MRPAFFFCSDSESIDKLKDPSFRWFAEDEEEFSG